MNFYQQFIYVYSQIITSLTDLLKDSVKSKKKDLFMITDIIEQAFHDLKQTFVNITLLNHYNVIKST